MKPEYVDLYFSQKQQDQLGLRQNYVVIDGVNHPYSCMVKHGRPHRCSWDDFKLVATNIDRNEKGRMIYKGGPS